MVQFRKRKSDGQSFPLGNNTKISASNPSNEVGGIKIGNGTKVPNDIKLIQSKPDIWVDGIPLRVIVDEDRISVSSIRYNKDENRYFHDQDIFSSGGKTDPFKFQTEEIQDEFNSGQPFDNSLDDLLKIARIAERKSGIGLGAYKQVGETREELIKMGVPV